MITKKWHRDYSKDNKVFKTDKDINSDIMSGNNINCDFIKKIVREIHNNLDKINQK